jgi:hypothetical protein
MQRKRKSALGRPGADCALKDRSLDCYQPIIQVAAAARRGEESSIVRTRTTQLLTGQELGQALAQAMSYREPGQ